MSTQTLHFWIHLPPFYLKKMLNAPLSEDEQMIDSAWDPINAETIDILLRSVGYGSFLINQRFFYLLHIATTLEEKLQCLMNNMDDLDLLIKQDKENENIYGTLFSFQSLHMAELYWEDKNSRNFAEEIWEPQYSHDDFFLQKIGLHSVLLCRLPLLKKMKKNLSDFLENATDDQALVTYAKALFYFSKDPFSKKAKEMLTLSLQLNPHVPDFLLTKKQIPKKYVDEIEPGQINEAKYISYLAGESWWSVKGAIDFLKSHVK